MWGYAIFIVSWVKLYFVVNAYGEETSYEYTL